MPYVLSDHFQMPVADNNTPKVLQRFGWLEKYFLKMKNQANLPSSSSSSSSSATATTIFPFKPLPVEKNKKSAKYLPLLQIEYSKGIEMAILPLDEGTSSWPSWMIIIIITKRVRRREFKTLRTSPKMLSQQHKEIPISQQQELQCLSKTLRQIHRTQKGEVHYAFKGSMIHVKCISQDISQFATFFIELVAQASTAKSCISVI